MKSYLQIGKTRLDVYLLLSLAIVTGIISGCASKKLPTAATPLKSHSEAVSAAIQNPSSSPDNRGTGFVIPRVSVTGQSGARGGTRPSFSGGGRGGGGGMITGGLRSTTQTRPISRSAGTEELWVIARNSNSTAPQDDTPGSGTLMTEVEGQQVPMPLKHTDVRASVAGYIGAVEVVQQFHNPYSSKIEAVYVFPLPHNAAVNEFIMTIGERRIRGIIRERKEAVEIYQAAKSQGYVASLLTEERPNIFTQSVANIEPGKEIDVTIKYFHTLDYVVGGMSSCSRWSSARASIRPV